MNYSLYGNIWKESEELPDCTMGNCGFGKYPIHSVKSGLLSATGLPRVALGKGLSVEILSVKEVFAESYPMSLGKRVP
jgi:hypothetical protein